MIVRILGDGQYEVSDSEQARFDELDHALVVHVESGDDAAFHRDLAELVDLVRTKGAELPEDELAVSDAVLPSPTATLAEVKELLAEDQQTG
jgi:hypothetical protein